MKNERARLILNDYRFWLLGHGPFYWSINELVEALTIAEYNTISADKENQSQFNDTKV